MSERKYVCSVSQRIRIGKPCFIYAAVSPKRGIKPTRIYTNAPCSGFVELAALQAAYINMLVAGKLDAFDLNPSSSGASGQSLDVPPIHPHQQFVIIGWYSGMRGSFIQGDEFEFCVTVEGTGV